MIRSGNARSALLAALVLFAGLPALYGCGDDGTAPALKCVEPPSGLRAWWPGDGSADDIAGGNPGTVHGGAVFTPGLVGEAFSFDGTDDYVEIPNPSLQAGADGSFTFSLWFRTTIDTDVNRGMATHFGPTVPDQWFAVMISGSEASAVCKDLVGGVLTPVPNHVVIGLRDALGNHISLCSGTLLNDGRFHHVAGSYDGSLKTLTGYFDGRPGGFVPAPLGSSGEHIGPGQVRNPDFTGIDWTRPFFLGNHLNRFFPLKLDELDFYDRALDAVEIRGVFDAGAAGKCK